MGKVLVIGCGGVASVAIQKCAMNSEVLMKSVSRAVQCPNVTH